MTKLVYIGEDDYLPCLKHGDVFCTWTVSGSGSYYIVENKHGEEVYIQEDEAVFTNE